VGACLAVASALAFVQAEGASPAAASAHMEAFEAVVQGEEAFLVAAWKERFQDEEAYHRLQGGFPGLEASCLGLPESWVESFSAFLPVNSFFHGVERRF